jgi:hypothetical protein
VQPSHVNDAESTVYVMDEHVPAALIAVHTFIALPSLQIEPFVHVVPPPLLLPLLLLPPPLLLVPPLPLVPPLLLPPPPPSAVVAPLEASPFDAPEHAATRATAPIHPKRATLMPPPTAAGVESFPANLWWDVDAIDALPFTFRWCGVRDWYPRYSAMSVYTKPPHDGSGASAPPKPDAQAGKPVPAPAKPPVAAPPSVIVSRSIDIGGPKSQARPSAPTIHIGPPTKQTAAGPAAPPGPSKTPTLKLESVPPPKSVRPMAPEMTPSDGVASIADTFERLLSSDVDQGFEALEREPGSSPKIDVSLTDLAEVRSLFAQLAANHVRQVRDFMIDLRWSDATADWIGICEPALKSLRRAADKLELDELCVALDTFSAALTGTPGNGARTIDGERRAAILKSYETLSEVMPQAFALDLDRSQREAVILQSLLLQVPEVKKITLDKLYAAGLTTLEAMLLATPGDVAATTGIDEALARHIVSRFADYKEQVRKSVPDATRANEREKVAELTARLRREHAAFEAAAKSWTRDADEQKKELRKARAQTLLDIQLVLARLGEVDRIKEIERLPFDRKLVHLESFLEEARDKYVAQP